MDNKQVILEKSAEVFMRYGLRSVTMDDLSRELGISKKTLYQYFTDKENLIEQVLDGQRCEEFDNFGVIRGVATDAVEEFLLISQFIQDSIKTVPPVLIFDLQKYHPQVWRKSLARDFQSRYDILSRNLTWGIEQGLYRAELPVDVAVRLYVAQMEGMVQEYIFPDSQLISAGIVVKDNLFLRGIATPAGLERLEHYRQQGLQRLTLPFLGKKLEL